eukprot:10008816-Ditylum_brightwellii.AAC.1
MEDIIDDSLLMPAPPSATGGDYAVHGNLIWATTPSPVSKEQETDDDLCAPSYKIYPSAKPTNYNPTLSAYFTRNKEQSAHTLASSP